MFKKLKDKLAEEVKSSPQRIQQFAQAAQAAVTSASSSISDITNNDLFSIGDNDVSQKSPMSSAQQQTFHEISLAQQKTSQSGLETPDISFHHEENSRQRRLSNSSFASDISFRLPTYESPSMYHIQSDMDVSASEAEEKGFSGGMVNLDRVTKEQLYSAYRRTRDRFTKYKTQYADLARHYKLLERENAKARNVLVETQDKALRRISELREQCTLEQSAKAHLEKALREDIEEKNMKIDSLNMKLKILQGNNEKDNFNITQEDPNDNETSSQLIDLGLNQEQAITNSESLQSEITTLNNKVEKMEQLLNKYKESLKISKEKNAQMTAEIQILSTDIENKTKEIEVLKSTNSELTDAKNKIEELKNSIEQIHSTNTAAEFSKNKEISVLKLDLEQAHEEISELKGKIEGLKKREEEYAISLAENKLRIHKELESKEAEIKSLKDSLTLSQNEVQSLNIILSDYKKNLSLLEEERSKSNNNLNELNTARLKIKELEQQLDEVNKNCQSIEHSKGKLDEEYKCLELQLKQETAEKLAMIDRNVYLENRNTQISEECSKKSQQIHKLEAELKTLTSNKDSQLDSSLENTKLLEEVDKWKSKYNQLESENQEERDELVKLQTEIEKLLCNHESVQTDNIRLHAELTEMKSKNKVLIEQNTQIKLLSTILFNKVTNLQQEIRIFKEEMKLASEEMIRDVKESLKEKLHTFLSNISKEADERNIALKSRISALQQELQIVTNLCESNKSELQLKIKLYEELEAKLKETKTEYDDLKEKICNNVEEHTASKDEMVVLKKENQNLHDKLQKEIALKTDINEKVDRLKEENKTLEEKVRILEEQIVLNKKEKDELMSKLKHIEEQKSTALLEDQRLKNLLEEHKNEKIDLEKKNKMLLEANKQLENAQDKLKFSTENLSHKVSESEIHVTKLKTEIETLNKEINRLENCNSEQESKYQTLLEKLKESDAENNKIGDEQNVLHEKMKSIQNAKVTVETDNKVLKDEIHRLKSNNDSLKSENNELNSKLQEIIAQNTALDSENKSNLKELNVIKDSNTYLQEKLNITKKQHEDDLQSLEVLRNGNSDLKRKLDENNAKFHELQKDFKNLESENIVLKNQCATISNNVKELEIEMLQVRNSHIEIENEKDHLNTIIKNLETHAKSLDVLNDVHTQTSESQEFNDKSAETSVEQTLGETINNNLDTTNLTSTSVQSDYAILKEENRRLRSDVEGLQTYLTKISKENSDLNDKLREVITSNDNFTGRSEISQYDIEALKNEIQSGRDKIDNLTRENTLLAEENLELKDQIHFQSLNKSDSINDHVNEDKNFSDITKKYNNLLERKNALEQRVKDLENVNFSANANLQEVQENNDKLRLSNDKLGRRLDEALVSLRHLHSLQENTELEYLRNILYEYMTGSGTHSLTLAKVLSAVVKFTDTQTELVMQKERERQGILRQLGIV
ncbi:PREDICTED: golgin subfamily A member 4-like [Papilio xuthus]|uniref:Golgin subfamily A member 4-like n=1 Tax=Papilio xuthus TaxID=66420 RepID=A0AAJ6Z7M0_PAPXU|nr:PREDICTED: golgin subfamily A member 4-like [Papilio xuthus]